MDTKKKSLSASEQDAQARAAWRTRMATVVVARLVFVDESGAHTRMTPTYAVAPQGQRAYGSAPRNHATNTTLVASLSLTGVGAAMTLRGALDTAAFVAWLAQELVPTLQAGQVIVLDNLTVHKAPAVRQLIEARGCELVYLPTYSPDYNPIEGMFSKVKQGLRRAAKRTQEGLEEAIGKALATVTAADARGWFAHCGFPPPPVQPFCSTL